MAHKPTSTYGKGSGPADLPPPSWVSTNDPDFSDPLPVVEARHARGENWCHNGGADGSYVPPLGGWTGAQLGWAVRSELARTDADEPALAEGIRTALANARAAGELTEAVMVTALEILRALPAGTLQDAATVASHRPTAAPEGRAALAKPNRYAGPCVRCGQRVGEGEGNLAKDANGKWAADHRGDCPPVAAPCGPSDTVTVAPSGPKGGAWETVPDGYYATDSRTGNNDLDFWRVSTAKGGEWAGFRSVSRVIGGRADERVKGGERKHALEAISADPAAAGMLFASELGRCMRCNRHLTDEASRAAGIGPECAKAL